MTKPGPKAPQDAYEAIFTGLAHPVRRRILMSVFFEGGSMTAGKIAALFEHAWPTTTRHLRSLEAAELLRHTREGRTQVYTLDHRPLELVRDWLVSLTKPAK
jgi:DNA-binding transcriptional ArsR family regulator